MDKYHVTVFYQIRFKIFKWVYNICIYLRILICNTISHQMMFLSFSCITADATSGAETIYLFWIPAFILGPFRSSCVHPWLLVGLVLLNLYVFADSFFFRSFSFAIVSPFHLQFTASHYHFRNVKLFIWAYNIQLTDLVPY